ncbi:hypothetical protein F5144DRAFT_554410 [Chaetomium tenue]|uniref:Uncharacterized protein n=1 Tax=Chaetomium tenue TaxID=1854479 RepID=A0ACB7PM48_9PEZI|nr:hypothetical protein F5144DRAFT_554410 [Chaetomium globosum]
MNPPPQATRLLGQSPARDRCARGKRKQTTSRPNTYTGEETIEHSSGFTYMLQERQNRPIPPTRDTRRHETGRQTPPRHVSRNNWSLHPPPPLSSACHAHHPTISSHPLWRLRYPSPSLPPCLDLFNIPLSHLLPSIARWPCQHSLSSREEVARLGSGGVPSESVTPWIPLDLPDSGRLQSPERGPQTRTATTVGNHAIVDLFDKEGLRRDSSTIFPQQRSGRISSLLGGGGQESWQQSAN